MKEWVIDACLALQWLLEDEADRAYSLAILKGLSENEAVVPILWYYEVGNGLTMAHRRKRITFQQVTEFLNRVEVASRPCCCAGTDDYLPIAQSGSGP